MKRKTTRHLALVFGVVVVVLAVVLSGCTSTVTTTPPAVTTTATVTSPPVTTTATATVTSPPVTTTYVPPAPAPSGAAIPPEVTKYAADWPLPQGNYEATRDSTTASINSQNVNTLGVAWTTPLLGATSTNPIIMGNTVYLQDNAYNIWSIDFSTGKVNWSVSNNHTWIGPAGVSVGWGKVFGSSNSYDIAAYDASTGQLLWSDNLSTANDQTHTNIQPLPYDGKVFTSTGPHVGGTEFGGVDGYEWAVDQATGKVVWSFSTTDSSNFFGNPQFNDGSGSWFPPSVDTTTGTIFWGTKNPGGYGYGGPNADYPNASQRPGPNLYSDSVLAMSASNGKLLWYNQTFPHDIYDHDLQNTPMLVTAPNLYGTNGATPVVIAGGKAGVVFAIDRTTGATLWSTPVGKHQNDTLGALPTDHSLEVFPGLLGGIETHMAYSNGLIYVPYVDFGAKYNAYGLQGLDSFSTGTGGLAALDVNTGKIVWDDTLPSMNFGAATVVNDLVFTSTYDGTLYAFNKTTGAQVWKYTPPSGMSINGWPAVAGDTILFPYGGGSHPMLVAFKLGATGSIPSN